MCVCKCFLLIFALLGAAVFVLGFILGFTVFENLIEDEVLERVRLKEGTQPFIRWREANNPNYLSVYVFHIINPQLVTSNQATPVVEERGPYVYRQTRIRDNIRHETSDRIYYQSRKNFVFDLVASEPRLATDQVTVLNVPLQATLQLFEELDMLSIFTDHWRSAFQISVDNTTPLFITISIDDLLLNGYRFCIGNTAAPLCNIIHNRIEENKLFRIEGDAVVFSFLQYMQHSRTFSISAGVEDHELLGEILSMDGSNVLNTWNDNICNRIRGTDSTIFAPFIEEESNLKVFYPDICRIFDLDFMEHITFKEIEGYRFNLRTSTLSAASPDRWCHCVNRTANFQGQRTCLPNGFEDMHTCLGNYLILSFPHLLDSDMQVQNTIQGLTPNHSIHNSYVDVQTRLGTPLTTNRRFQYNMFIRQNSELTVGITPFVMPVLWFDDYMELHTDVVNDIEENFINWIFTLEVVTWVLVAVGGAVAVVSVLLCICC